MFTDLTAEDPVLDQMDASRIRGCSAGHSDVGGATAGSADPSSSEWMIDASVGEFETPDWDYTGHSFLVFGIDV